MLTSEWQKTGSISSNTAQGLRFFKYLDTKKMSGPTLDTLADDTNLWPSKFLVKHLSHI